MELVHGWASAELPRNRVKVNLSLRHIRDLSSRKSQTKVGTLACFDFLYQNELCKNPAILFHVDMIYLAKQAKCDVEKSFALKREP